MSALKSSSYTYTAFMTFMQALRLTQSDAHLCVSPTNHGDTGLIGSAHIPPTLPPRTAPKPKKVCEVI